MAKLSEIVTNAVNEMQELLQKIEDTDDGDLKETASLFDQVGEKADDVAARLTKADDALSEMLEKDKDDEDEKKDQKKKS
jgi:hypothetical protein